MTGEVFDIKRFAVHDGPGIRCTAFLKGCPLDCVWCHNPEGKRPGPEIGHLPAPCIRCAACVKACPSGAIGQSGGSVAVDRALCTRCGRCVAACPSGAMIKRGGAMEADELMREFAKEAVFFEASNGGVTLSGGDPLFQPEFAAEVLQKAKTRGYHTAVETCLHTAADVFEGLLELADIWIVDLKIWDDDAHRKLTGRTNRLIFGNYERLAGSDRPMLTRIPVIPGCTDSEENLAALAEYIAKVNPGGEVELMFYNPLAQSKYKNYDIEFPLYGLKPYAAEQRERFRGIVAAEGVQTI